MYSDHRENMFGESSRVEIAARQRREAVALRTAVWNEAREAKRLAEEARLKAAAEKADRKEARRLKKEEKKKARELERVAAGAREVAARAKAEREAKREAALAVSRHAGTGRVRGSSSSSSEDDDDDEENSDDELGFDSDDDEGWRKRLYRRKHYKGKIKQWKSKPLKPLLPNSGTMLYDDERWTFLPHMRSLPGPQMHGKSRLRNSANIK